MPDSAPPRQIMVIHHGEKPTGQRGQAGGVTHKGEPDDHSLTVRGWQRAGALAVLFARPIRTDSVSVPDRLVCPAYPDRRKHRPHQTLQPLAGSLDRVIEELGLADDPRVAVDAVLSDPRTALLCWDHEHIPALAALIPSRESRPSQWPEDRFDLVWVFTRTTDRPPAYSLSITGQGLLGGDDAPDGAT